MTLSLDKVYTIQIFFCKLYFAILLLFNKLAVATGFSLRREITHCVNIEKYKNPRNLKVAATFNSKNRSI